MTFARRYRLDTLRRHQEMLTDAQLDVIEAATAAMVASNRRQHDADATDHLAWLQAHEADLQRMLAETHPSDVLGLLSLRARLDEVQAELNDSPECDGSLPSPDANRTAPNTLADRDCDGTSAPFQQGERVEWDPEPWQRAGVVDRYCDEHSEPRVKVVNEYGAATCIAPDKLYRAIGTTSSGRVAGQQTPGTSTAKTSRDNAPVAVSEASPEGRSAGDVLTPCPWCWASDNHEFGCPTWTAAVGPDRFIAGDCATCGETIYENQTRRGTTTGLMYHHTCDAPEDFDLDAATAETDCNALEALTGPGVPDWQPVPGEQVEVVEAVGSRTGPRRAIGTYRGDEADTGPAGGIWRLVEVYGVVRRFRAVGRVG